MLGGIPLPTAGVQSLTVPDPAAGAQWNYVFPAGYQYLVLGLQFRMVTNNTPASRYPGYGWVRPGVPFNLRIQMGVPIVALSDYICVWLTGRANIQTVTVGALPLTGTHQMTLAYPLILNPLDELGSDCVQFQAGDQMLDIFLYYLRMPLTS
jgi:hypothetical protein